MVERPPLRDDKSIIHSSGRWDAFTHRPDDIFVCTPPKVGTTWTQGIVRSMISGADEPTGSLGYESPWLDSRFEPIDVVIERLEGQAHRRCIKTHTPADAIPLFGDAKYVAVYRGGLDSFMSWVNHYRSMLKSRVAAMVEEAIADGVELGPPPSGDGVHEIFADWIRDPPQLVHFDTWWPLRAESNVTVLHYNDLLEDLEGEVRRLAAWLEIEVPADAWPRVVERCRLDEMRKAASGDQRIKEIFDGGAESFFHKGTNGRWRGVLSDEEVAAWQELLVDRVPDADARDWFERGSLATGRRPASF